jgi:flagellar biosynthetic protein FliQ
LRVNQAVLLDLARQTILLILMLAAPMLGAALVIGLVISIFQAVTQIQEATLAFVPKILGVFLALALFGTWMLNTMLVFTANLLTSLPTMTR